MTTTMIVSIRCPDEFAEQDGAWCLAERCLVIDWT